jgi:MYXO-CTERM domain-containing protein
VPGLPAGGAASFAIALDPPQAPAAVSACLPGGDGNLANDCAALTLEAAAVDVGLAWVGPGPVTPEQPVDVPLDLLIVGCPVDVAVRVEASGAVLEALPPGCTGTAGLAVCAIDAASGAVRLPLRAAPLGAGASLTARRLGPLVDDVAANDLAIVALPVDGPGPCGDGAAPIDLGPLSGAAPSDAGAGFTADGQAWVLAEDPEAGAALTWPALDLPPGTTRVLLAIDHAWTGAEALSAALLVDGIPIDLAPSWDLAPLVGDAPAGATSRAVVDAVAARAGLRLAADDPGATWRIEAARLAACVTEAHADLVVALGPGPAAAGVGEVVEIPVAVSGPGPATLTVAAQGVELVGLSGLGACELGCDGACARCEAVSLPAAGAVLALGGEDAVARLTVAALAGVDPTPEDAVATVSFPVGEPPPTLTWAGAPTSLPPGGAGEATLIVADALGRAVVELDLGVAGGSFALGACVEPGRPCAVAPGSHLVALRAGGPGTLRVEAAAAEADGPIAAVEIPIGPVAARAVSIDAPAGPWLAGVPVAFTVDVAAADPGLTLTVRAPAALTTTDPRCAPVDGGLRCAVDGAAAIHATAVPAVGPLALVAAIDGPAADADPEDDVAVHLVEVVADCAAATCDDANPCTEDACDPARGCVSAPLDGTCAAADACDAPGVCMEGACVPLVICDDGDPCTVDACEDGACAHAAADEGSACLDDACTEAGACVEGACAPLFTAACDDGDACTDDACDPEGGCDHEAVITPACCAPAQARVGCAGDASVWLDACGVVSGPLEGCDDGDPCTLDACVEGVGCEHTPSADPDCACDGVAVGAACVGDGVALVDACGEPVGDVFSCEDGDDCTLDYCDPTAAVCARTLDPTCEGAVCEGEWTLTCEGELATWEDPCGEPAGPADRCASEDPCVAWACVEEAGCAAEPACLEQACDARPGTLACEAGDAVARDACGVELGRLECAALGERATCDAESGRCVRPADPSDLPDTWRADGGVDTGDTDTRRGSCGCATGGPGGELVGLLGLALGLGIRRRRARTAAPAHARAASNSCASAADRPKCPPLGGP